jgi:GT2 family glycosyltransferase
VNYNVRYFLEQCLLSVARASGGIDVEVIVVDNNSTDGSEAYLKERFPDLIYKSNTENVGFGRACNQGLTLARGSYILFLNPDTILQEDCLHTCLDFFKKHPDTGAIGVRMVDGTGAFLKESKRSFPSPLTALYKLSGLSLLFPHSRLFGRYHLGHLGEDQNWEVDVLAGAFMLIPRAVLDNVGSFDEAFFMYGEDVDLSYRIQAAGYKNWYLADTTIIHFKGESTKRGSLNYVRLFYSAMNIFVRKHYGGARATLFRLSIQGAIWVRAALAALAKFLRWTGLPVIDGLLILAAFWLAKEVWTGLVRPDIRLPQALINVSLPAYTILYIITAYYAGLYDKVYRRRNLLRAAGVAALVLLAAYALLPENLRFSRAILVGGATLGFAAIGTLRRVLLDAGVLQHPMELVSKPYILVAAAADEYLEVQGLLGRNGRGQHLIGRVGNTPGEAGTVAALQSVRAAVRALGAGELILCAGRLSDADIIRATEELGAHVRLRYHSAGSSSIVGSDSRHSSGEALSLLPPLRLAEPGSRRSKRCLDMLVTLFLLATLPVSLLLSRRPLGLLRNLVQVLAGSKTWVGYRLPAAGLPRLRNGVLGPGGVRTAGDSSLTEESLHRADYWYARNYDVSDDLRIIFKNYRWLGL